MSDLFQGQTMTYAASFEFDTATAFTFTLPFQADKVEVYNYTSWADTAGLPFNIWIRGMPDGDALQWQGIVDNGGSTDKNMLLETTNGFTVADTSGGPTSYQSSISAVSQADPCVVTTSAVHGYSSGQLVRITDLGNVGPSATARGMNQIDGKRFKIVVIDTTNFSLQDPISGDAIDSTAFTTWVSGGFVTLESRSLGDPEAFDYLPIVYKLTFGTSIWTGATDGDLFYFVATKFGEFAGLGDLADLR